MMAPVLLTLLALTIAGMPIAQWLDRRASGALLLGESMLVGLAAATAALGVESLLHVRWSIVLTALIVLTASVAAFVAVRRRHLPHVVDDDVAPSRVAVLLDLFTASVVGGYVIFATLASAVRAACLAAAWKNGWR